MWVCISVCQVFMCGLMCVFQRLTKVINMALLSVIRPLSRLPCAPLINTHCQREAPLIQQQHTQILYQCFYNAAAGQSYLCCSHRDAPAINQTERKSRLTRTSFRGMMVEFIKQVQCTAHYKIECQCVNLSKCQANIKNTLSRSSCYCVAQSYKFFFV